jgi:hypothetical protein
MRSKWTAIVTALALVSAGPAAADGIVGAVVNAPLSATGTVTGAHTGINVYLQSPQAPGIEFMDPKQPGYAIPAGGRLEVEMGEGFERDWAIDLTNTAIMLVTGAPQQGLPGKMIGYTVTQGSVYHSDDDKTFVITPTKPDGLSVDDLMSPAPGAKADPIRQRGLKVIHVGFLTSAFRNSGDTGTVRVRIVDGAGGVVHEGSGTVTFLGAPVAQILPTNMTDKRRNHNWQRVRSAETLGHTPGTVPVTLLLYAKATGVAAEDMVNFKQGIVGAGVLSTQQLKAMDFAKPEALARYTGGLIVEDADGDGRLDLRSDRIIGGVIGAAPTGAKGQELRTLERDGKLVLSRPADEFDPKMGKRFGGALMQLQFAAGDKPGRYRPTLALLTDPADPAKGDGSSYTYTIVVE